MNYYSENYCKMHLLLVSQSEFNGQQHQFKNLIQLSSHRGSSSCENRWIQYRLLLMSNYTDYVVVMSSGPHIFSRSPNLQAVGFEFKS